jgi:hypothetical protein
MNSNEAKQYRTVLDLRPLAPRKGDIDDKLDAHYVLAMLRYLRESIGNLTNRNGTTRVAKTVDAILISRDDKARIFLNGGTPTARPFPQMHLVARDDDGHVLPPAATLPTVEFGKVAADSVICHTMLVAIRSVIQYVNNALFIIASRRCPHRTSSICIASRIERYEIDSLFYVFQYIMFATATTPATHLAETIFHILQWPHLWLAGGLLPRCVMFITDRVNRTNFYIYILFII